MAVAEIQGDGGLEPAVEELVECSALRDTGGNLYQYGSALV